MMIGIAYDLREDYARQGYDEEETAEFDCIETIAAIELALSSLGHSTITLVTRARSSTAWVKAIAGTWSSTSPKGCMASADRRWCRRCWTAMQFHTRSPTRSPCPSRCIRAWRSTSPAIWEFPPGLRDHQGPCGPRESLASVPAVREARRRRHEQGNRPEIEGPRPVRAAIAMRAPAGAVPPAGPGRDVLARTGLHRRHPRHRRVACALGVMEILLQEEAEPEVYSYTNKKHYEQRVRFRLVADAASATARRIALDAWIGLGCRDGGRVDLRCDATGRANFIEVNPLAGLNPNSDLVILGRLRGVPYVELIERIVASATGRSAARSAGGPVGHPHHGTLNALPSSPPAWHPGGSLVANRTKGCFQSIAIGLMIFLRTAEDGTQAGHDPCG